MFQNRLTKNKKELGKWAMRSGIEAYRIYDKDVPQVPVIVDKYGDYLVLNYFRGPYDMDDPTDKTMDRRIQEIAHIITMVFQIPDQYLFIKLREKKKGKSQYEKLAQTGKTIYIKESEGIFKINLSDYLDVGLFLDHRPLRRIVANQSAGKSLLNLFSYTGSFSVLAAKQSGTTTNIDISPVYMEWTKANFLLNKLSLSSHEFFATDVLDWVFDQNNRNTKYDIIVLDPPTFSNSKRSVDIFEVQKDHAKLIKTLMEIYLNPNGVLYFSNNFRKFVLDPNLTAIYNSQNITNKTFDKDIRDHRLHQVWEIRHRSSS